MTQEKLFLMSELTEYRFSVLVFLTLKMTCETGIRIKYFLYNLCRCLERVVVCLVAIL